MDSAPKFDFLSKIKSTLEGLWGNNGNATNPTMAPVNVSRQAPPQEQQQPQPPLSSQDPQIDQSRQAAVDGLVAQGITDPNQILLLLNGQGGKNKGDFTFQEVQLRLQQAPPPPQTVPQPVPTPDQSPVPQPDQSIPSAVPDMSAPPVLADQGFTQALDNTDKARQGVVGLMLLLGSLLGDSGQTPLPQPEQPQMGMDQLAGSVQPNPLDTIIPPRG